MVEPALVCSLGLNMAARQGREGLGVASLSIEAWVRYKIAPRVTVGLGYVESQPWPVMDLKILELPRVVHEKVSRRLVGCHQPFHPYTVHKPSRTALDGNSHPKP